MGCGFTSQRARVAVSSGGGQARLTGHHDFVATAPLNLIYVAHGERMTDVSPEERRLYASVDAAFTGENVYLFCAAEGLATVFRGALDNAKLARTLRLPEGQFVTFAQTVGHPRG
jgi:nitroreductase